MPSIDTVWIVLATILGPVSGYLFKSYWNKKDYISIPLARKNAVSKTWVGTYKYATGALPENSSLELPIQIELKVKGKKVTGKASYSLANGSNRLQILEGGFQSDNLLMLLYKSDEDHSLRFGCYILQFDAEVKSMKGSIAGFGTEPDRPFTATVSVSSS